MQQRDEKVLDAALDTFSQRLNELKQSLAQMLHKLEVTYDDLTWPSLLDSFALLSGELNSLLRVLRHEKTPPLRQRVTLPLLLSAETDQQLVELTERRVTAVTHDLVPLYLRTKPDPVVEQRQNQLENKAASTSAESTQKQVNTMNKAVNNLLETVCQTRDDWSADTTRSQLPVTYTHADTHFLIAAIGTGKGLKPAIRTTVTPSPMIPTASIQMTNTNKAPSSIKTNIKTNIHGHPYKQ